jgi:hypothetical protein
MSTATRKVMTLAEWNAEGERRFGPDRMQWKFVCPVCGHVASVQDWKDAGASETEVAFSCVGRHIPGSRQAFGKIVGDGPCTYAGGGLFRFNPVEVEGHKVFDFAEVAS